jgi:hypothetical protein
LGGSRLQAAFASAGAALVLAGCGVGSSVVLSPGAEPTDGPSGSGCSIAGYNPGDPNSDPHPTPTCWGGATLGTPDPNSVASDPDVYTPPPEPPLPDLPGRGRPSLVSPQYPQYGANRGTTHAWDEVQILDQHEFRLFFTLGPCQVLSALPMAESPTEITVTIYVRPDPELQGKPCTTKAFLAAVDVHPASQVGAHEFVDGASGARRPLLGPRPSFTPEPPPIPM